MRDLFSRVILLVEHVPAQSEAAVRRAMRRCFQRHGIPKRIRVDNGAPFFVGNQGSVRIPATGQLYLGINDDVLTDNTGDFFDGPGGPASIAGRSVRESR